jgi:hypothetical protein
MDHDRQDASTPAKLAPFGKRLIDLTPAER